jgi:hypothetical protein
VNGRAKTREERRGEGNEGNREDRESKGESDVHCRSVCGREDETL